MNGRAIIAGWGESLYQRHPPRDATATSVLVDAIQRALANAGIEHKQVDGLAVGSYTLAPDHGVDLAWRLGMKLSWVMDDHTGGAGGIHALRHAIRAVEAGDASVVVAVAGDYMGAAGFAHLADSYNAVIRDYLAPIGWGGFNTAFAFVTQRHMKAHGLSREDYGHLVVAQRTWAGGNPGAVYRKPLSLEEYMAAPAVVDPLSRYDCVPVVTGGDAIVVVADDVPHQGPSIRVRAIGSRINYDQQEGTGLHTGLSEVAPRLWADANMNPDDVDVISIYDDYPVMVLVQLEDLGVISDGDVKRFVNSELAEKRRPINTSGGMLSAGQAAAAGGMHGLVEAVAQLRGECRERQVAKARIALVSGYGMVLYRYATCSNAVVLERDA